MIQGYIQAINAKFITGKTTEHSFRGDLQSLIEAHYWYRIYSHQRT